MPGRLAAWSLEPTIVAALVLLSSFAGVTRADGVHAVQLTTRDSSLAQRYACPMHCQGATQYERPGNCPVCGMILQLITTDRYSVDVRPAGGTPRSGTPVELAFQLRDPLGTAVVRLEIVHEKLLHLMIVAEDLSWFEHVHPLPTTEGRFHLRVTFPHGGRYVLFHDFTPPDVGMQVVAVELSVEGSPPAIVPLVIDIDRPKRVDGYEVTLAHTALALDAECALTFTLMRGGKPVTDLEPFLGAMGHMVVISQDRATYVHSHPLPGNATNGPSVQFNTTFPRTGIFKAWGQFQRHGRVITVPFVFEVTPDGHTHPAPGAAADSPR